MTQTITPAITVRKTLHSNLSEVNWDNLQFGQYSTDHMLICDYQHGHWGTVEIVPFANFSLSPMAMVFHYGQTVFEGMKAFRTRDGQVQIFRPQKHYERMVLSTERLCMPMISEELFLEGLRKFVEIDRDWVPSTEGGALYIRPFMIATESRLLAHISDTYRFAIVASPSGPYYGQPIRIKVEREYVRAPRGGTGFAKCGGNYGGAFYPTEKAKEQGYDQVIWTDSKDNKYIEEAGTMNIMLVIGGKLLTPPLSDSILDGVTRDSLLTLAREAGIKVEERPISVDEIKTAFKIHTITEAFGVGTAAVVSLIRTIGIDGQDYDLPQVGPKSTANILKSMLDALRSGEVPDQHSWNFYI